MKLRTPLLLTAAAASAAVLVPGPADAAASRVRAAGPLVRYDTALVPEGAMARVQAVATASGATVFTLHVRGLMAHRTYGAHVHVRACGAAPSDAGPHYQHRVAPAGQGANPTFANPDNEVWLDLTTDDEGNGSAQARVDWQTRPGAANSVILHASQTSTGQTTSGTAGPRVGCLTAGF